MSLTTAPLPVRLTPLVGRESELSDIVRAVTRARLITLTGPGGTGKTRLALAAARSASESFPAGVCWVELAQIEDPGIVASTLAARLGVPDTPGQDMTEAVAESVADHQLLVVLHNCEHLAGATAVLAESPLAACPALTVLATSREALGVEGELNWQVPPLSLPRAGPAPTAASLALRLPLSVRIAGVLEGPELALVICERRVAGTGPDGEQVRLSGHGCAVLRPQPDGGWRIAADAWRVGTELRLDPSGTAAGTDGDPVPGEGHGRTHHGPFG